jgi:hypothetical protein
MGGRSRFALLLLAAVVVTACGGGQAKWAFPTGPMARPDRCKVAVNQLAGFTGRLADDIVALRAFLVADNFESAETARGVKGVSATLEAFPDLQKVAQECDATAELAARAGALETSATTAVKPSLASSPAFEGEVHWLAAYHLVKLLPETLSLSAAARAAGEPLAIVVAVAADPVGSSPPEIPLGPFVKATPDFRAFADRALRRGTEFNYLVDTELPNLAGGSGEVRRIGHRLVTFGDTEIKWLKGHQPETCYRQYWRAVMADWYDIKAAGNQMVDVSTDSAVKSLKKARNHLTTLMARDYISEANARCLKSPGETAAP